MQRKEADREGGKERIKEIRKSDRKVEAKAYVFNEREGGHAGGGGAKKT